jgi:hypothetical protein
MPQPQGTYCVRAPRPKDHQQHCSHDAVQMSTTVTLSTAVLQDLVRIQGEELLRVRQQLHESVVGPRELFPKEYYLIVRTRCAHHYEELQ